MTDHSDMFVSRNATASVEAAKTGVTALKNALATFTTGGPGVLIPADTFIKVATNSITQTESALWWE